VSPSDAIHAPDYEALYLALVESHADLISRYDPDGTLTFVSDAYAAFFGLPPERLLNKSIFDLITPEEREGSRRRLAGVTKDRPTVAGRNKVALHSGSIRWVDWVTRGFFSPTGELTGFQSVGRDVTPFHNIRARLSETETRYAQAIQIAHLGHWLWDEIEGRLDYCSQEAADIYGITVDRALQRSATLEGNMASVHPDDRAHYEETVERAAREKAGYDITFRCYRPDGTLLYLREVAQSMLDGEGNLSQTIGTIQDVTEQKLAEQELRENQILLQRQIVELRESERRLRDQSNALRELAKNLETTRNELEISNEQKNRLFSIIAHDLKSPFTPLLGFTELLSQDGADISQETVRDYAQSIHQTAQQIHTLLSDLLDWSRLQLDRLIVAPETLDVLTTVGVHIAQFTAAARAKEIELSFVAPQHRVEVEADPRIVDTILRNLLSNAIKFTPRGGAIQVTLRQEAEELRVAVRDNGLGMPEEVLRSVSRSGPIPSREGTGGEKGTGLGLMLCKDLVEHHGGVLEIVNLAEGGTEAAFVLPVRS
jgi:PAS domain S-box-containing protein